MKTPRPLLVGNTFILLIFLMPIFYMFWRFANFSKNLASFLSSWDVATLLLNTLLLFFAVIFSSLLLGLLISILTVRYEFPGSKILFSLTILPLVIPSYIGAFNLCFCIFLLKVYLLICFLNTVLVKLLELKGLLVAG